MSDRFDTGQRIADQGRLDRRTAVKRVLPFLLIGTLLLQWDIRDGSLDWSLAQRPSQEEPCERVAELSRVAHNASLSKLSARNSLPVNQPPPLNFAERSDLPLDLEAAIATHSEYMPEWRESLTHYEYTNGWQRVWVHPSGKTLVAEVYEFATPEDARGLHRWAGDHACRFAREVFAVEAIPASVGQAIEHDEGFMTEQVAFVRGTRRYLIVVGPRDAQQDRALLIELANAVEELAT